MAVKLHSRSFRFTDEMKRFDLPLSLRGNYPFTFGA